MTSDEDMEFRAMSYGADGELDDMGLSGGDASKADVKDGLPAFEPCRQQSVDSPIPCVGHPASETEADSRLQQLLASAYTVFCTINLVDHMRGRSPLVRSKRNMKIEGV